MSFLEELKTLNATAEQLEEQERQKRAATAEASRLRGMAYALTILEDIQTELRKTAQEGWRFANLCYNRDEYHTSLGRRDSIFAAWPCDVNDTAFARGIAARLRKELGAGFNISLSVDEECRPASDDDAIKICWSSR